MLLETLLRPVPLYFSQSNWAWDPMSTLKFVKMNCFFFRLLHSVLYDYMTECGSDERAELITTLSPLIVPLSNSLPGVNAACVCVWQGTNKDKKVSSVGVFLFLFLYNMITGGQKCREPLREKAGTSVFADTKLLLWIWKQFSFMSCKICGSYCIYLDITRA